MKTNVPTVLLVDDEPDIVVLLSLVAEQEGYRALIASTGGEALEILAKGERPAAILLDLMMPEMSGFQFCRYLKSRPDLASIPVIVLSARTQPLDKFKAEDCGADAFLTKPFDLDEVVAALKRFTQAPVTRT